MIKKFLYAVWSKFLTFFGDIKIFKFPFWMVYDPSFFQMTGDKILEAMEVLEPGDVILRSYVHYLDGCFINGDYSHGAVYIGDNTIIHAIAPSVSKINAIEFMECDGIVIYRPRKYKKSAVARAKKFLKEKVPYDFLFSKDVTRLYCFQLARECYEKLDIPSFTISKFFGLVKKEVYLGDSFKESKDFERVFEYNPQKGIDYRKPL